MVLKDSEIIQIDATMIVGVLIFLTIGNDVLIGGDIHDSVTISDFISLYVPIVVLLMITPFATSAFLMTRISTGLLRKNPIDSDREMILRRRGILLMNLGFGYVMIGAVFITFVRMYASGIFILQ